MDSKTNSNVSDEVRMLLIDDDPVYGVLLKKFAKIKGIKVDVFESLSQIEQNRWHGTYCAAIIDYDLGDVTGVQVSKRLSGFYEDLPMVLVSATNRSSNDSKRLPPTIIKYVNKSEGHEFVLNQVVECLSNFESLPKRSFFSDLLGKFRRQDL